MAWCHMLAKKQQQLPAAGQQTVDYVGSHITAFE
jgi:hypothetical protein